MLRKCAIHRSAVQHGFKLRSEQYITEYGTTAQLYKHVKTGAELLSLQNSDENKVFGINFKTPVSDDTGAPHILEHSVLCGSEKFPCKDPMVELLKGSVNTFLNAMTFPDKTSYPIASQNIRDFYNLASVWADAAFFPALTKQTFLQEGWHYSVAENNGNSKELGRSGVVFNEMKGVYSSPPALVGSYSRCSLFPDTCYTHEYGGHPSSIPQLSYQQFLAFHQLYYSPSNARIYFYGDGNNDDRLKFINEILERYHQKFNGNLQEGKIPEISLQQPFKERARKVYPFDSNDSKGFVTLNWVMTPDGNPWDPETRLALEILEDILIGSSASPLKKALLESGLGSGLCGHGLDDHLQQPMFSVGLNGVENAEETAQKIESIVMNTLSNLVTDGIHPHTLQASLNTIEFRRSEANTGGYPRGLIFMFYALTNWNYGQDPVIPIRFSEPLARIRQLSLGENKVPYFENMIKKLFLDNTHSSLVTVKPVKGLQAQQDDIEKAHLQQIFTKMSVEEIQQTQQEEQQLKEYQSTPDATEVKATIPRLSVNDLELQGKTVPREIEEITLSNGSTATVLSHNIETSGIVYFNWAFDLHHLHPSLLQLLPLYCTIISGQTGTEQHTMNEMLQRIRRHTGGVSADAVHSRPSEVGVDQVIMKLIVTAKATHQNVDRLNDILLDLWTSPNLNNKERVLQIVKEQIAGIENSIIPAGHRYVAGRVNYLVGEKDEYVGEQLSGFNYLLFLRDLLVRIETSWEGVHSCLQQVHQQVMSSQHAVCNTTCNNSNQYTQWHKQLLSHLPHTCVGTGGDGASGIIVPQSNRKSEAVTIPAQVNYVGLGSKLGTQWERHGSEMAVVNLINTSWLWEQVRVLGGAYGCFGSYDSYARCFTFASYRDPNILNTFDAYQKTAEWLLSSADVSQRVIDGCIISSVGKLDGYKFPDAKGYNSMIRHILGETDEKKQQRREELLGTKREHFTLFGEALKDMLNGDGLRSVVLGGEEGVLSVQKGNPSHYTRPEDWNVWAVQ